MNDDREPIRFDDLDAAAARATDYDATAIRSVLTGRGVDCDGLTIKAGRASRTAQTIYLWPARDGKQGPVIAIDAPLWDDKLVCDAAIADMVADMLGHAFQNTQWTS